jgi:hypothetical protein
VNSRAADRIRFWSPVVASGAVVLALGWVFARPMIGEKLYKERYKQLAYQCDNAMHDEAAIRSYGGEGEKANELVVSADVQLMVCHEYDKLRKRMLIMGVTDDQLALFALESIEIEQVPLERMAEPHRIPKF